MALEMKVHKDIANFEAKPMFGLTWRQLGAMVIMVFVGGGVFFGVVSAVLAASGADWNDVLLAATTTSSEAQDKAEIASRATNIGMWAMFPVVIPAAAWGWLRPKGLKPEIYFQYVARHLIVSRFTNYADTYSQPAARADEPVPDTGKPRRSAQQSTRRREARRRRALSEH